MQAALGLSAGAHDMAWSIALAAADTQAPTGAPTNATSTEPSDAPIDDEDILVWPNVSAPTLPHNGTSSALFDATMIRVLVSSLLACVVACCLCCLCVYYCAKRRGFQKKQSEKVMLQELSVHYNNEKPMNPLSGGDAIVARYDETKQASSTTVRYDAMVEDDVVSMSFIELGEVRERNK